MESRDEYNDSVPLSMDDNDSDSSIHADEESARLDFAGIFSNKFSNISLLYNSSNGATEIHTATRYGKRFALKGLKKDRLDDPISNMCLAKEFEIGISLDHPNIRRTLGLENVDTLGKRIVLEYIDGIRLSEMISEKSISPEKAGAMALQMADAVRYLHGKQIFHRDLKPDNILVSHQGGNVKIIDFNLSDRDDYVILKHPAGSKRYMAP
ncbi:MAG: protein kinase, partial [Muribaculaceae bacterium]|nr:protein kinase [Muribaculaceae bacterium]